jgi:hypothetical protein
MAQTSGVMALAESSLARRKTVMNMFRIKTISLAVTLIATLINPFIAGTAGTALALRCALDQQMWINGGGDGFGGGNTPGQTFTPTAPGHVCKVVVWIHKNDAAAGPLTLRIRRHDLSPLPGGSMTIPGGAIPMGLSEQSFNFACGPLLAGSPYYGLTLEAPGSAAAAYTWINSDDAGADAAYGGGHGYYKVGGAWRRAGYDYAFKVYMCRP